MDISEVALGAQAAWLRNLADNGFPQVRAGRDGFAVATGLVSNAENGAVIAPSVVDDPAELDALLGWLRRRAVPASVVVIGPLTPQSSGRLVEQGLIPERTGNNMGRLLTGADGPPATEWRISEVADPQALRESFSVYAADGWWDDPGEAGHRVEVANSLGYGPGRPIRHWVAHHRGLTVGAATSFEFGDTVLLVQSCVAEPWRRQGIGTALTRARLAAAAGNGAAQAVVFPSPDGYHLHRSLGFGLAPVHPDRCFYLP